MVEISRKRVYSEVYGILESMGDTYKNAIPKKLYKFIKENRDTNYSPTYNMKLPLSNQNLSPRTTVDSHFIFSNNPQIKLSKKTTHFKIEYPIFKLYSHFSQNKKSNIKYWIF